MDAAASPTRAGLGWLATKRVTLGVVAVLLGVFATELLVRGTFGVTGWQYVFLADATPSPGWILAPYAHRSLDHLITTLSVVVVYGSMIEDRFPATVFVLFYVAAGYASTAAQLGGYVGGSPGLGTLGASGAALALVALFTTTTGGNYVRDPGSESTVAALFAVTGVVIVGLVVGNDFLPGLQFATGTAPYGHLGGILTGVSYGVVTLRAEHRNRGHS